MKRERLERLKETLEKLEPHEHAQLFAIVSRHTQQYTKTEKGALVSSDVLPEACITEMERMSVFLLDQRAYLSSTRTQ